VALIADHHPAGTRATAMGIHMAGLNFGMVAGGFAAGYLGEHFGWRANFFVLGAAGLALAAVARVVLADGPRAKKAPASAKTVIDSLGELLRVPTYLVILAEAMLIAIGTWMFLNWLPLYFEERFRLSLAGAGFSGTFMLQAAATGGVIAGGYLSDRIAGRHPEWRLLVLAANYALAAPFLLAFYLRSGYGVLSFSIFGYAAFRALGSSNECPIICDLLPTDLRSAGVGLMNTCNCFAGGVGILIAGLLKRDYGLAAVFSAISATVLLASGIAAAGYYGLARKSAAGRPALTLLCLGNLASQVEGGQGGHNAE
jgi:predicted MFS family arabinose efflux permease